MATTFHLVGPLLEAPPRGSSTGPKGHSPGARAGGDPVDTGGSPREGRSNPVIAVVDDEQDILTYLRLALQDHGFEVVTTADPDRAMPLLTESLPDLICLDLLMPKHTGLSLYAEIVSTPGLKGVPIVIMSGLAVRGDLPDLLRRAGDLPQPSSFIDKPIDIEELVRTVNALLGRPVGVAP